MIKDEQVTIQSILLALREEGVKTSDVAKQIQGVSEKPFRNALKAAGYEYRNQAPKGWHFIGEGEEPLEKSIFDYVKKSSPRKKSNSPKLVSGNTDVLVNSPDIHKQFTHDEVRMIKEMLFEWKRVSMQGVTQEVIEEPIQHDLTLHDRIKQLPQGDKTRKTIVIDKEVGNLLDEFCRTERVNKSDILHLALMDFLEKYNQ